MKHLSIKKYLASAILLLVIIINTNAQTAYQIVSLRTITDVNSTTCIVKIIDVVENSAFIMYADKNTISLDGNTLVFEDLSKPVNNIIEDSVHWYATIKDCNETYLFKLIRTKNKTELWAVQLINPNKIYIYNLEKM